MKECSVAYRENAPYNNPFYPKYPKNRKLFSYDTLFTKYLHALNGNHKLPCYTLNCYTVGGQPQILRIGRGGDR